MYWVTTRSCLRCGEVVYFSDDRYEQLKKKILSELPGEPSNPWTESSDVHFGIGLVKIYIAKKKHEFFKYKMKCYSCDSEFNQKEYEKYLAEERIHRMKRDFRKRKLKAFPDQFGLWQYGKMMVPPLEIYPV